MARLFGKWRPGASGESRVCAVTGLMLRRGPTNATTRIAKPSFGPLNPVLRGGGSGNRATWGRYDVAAHRTIYTADPTEGAYAESVAAQRVAQSLSTRTISQVFADNAGEPDARESILEAIEEEWAERHHMRPRNITAGWREERRQYAVHLPSDGWFVDIEAPESILALKKALSGLLVQRDKEMLTVADLRGEDRRLTTEIAGWVWARVLDDDSLPRGIVYSSKYANDWRCWAVWLRATDAGTPEEETTTAGPGREIEPPAQNAALRRVAELFDVTIH